MGYMRLPQIKFNKNSFLNLGCLFAVPPAPRAPQLYPSGVSISMISFNFQGLSSVPKPDVCHYHACLRESTPMYVEANLSQVYVKSVLKLSQVELFSPQCWGGGA